MSLCENRSADTDRIHLRAQAIVRERATHLPPPANPPSSEDIQLALQELRVRQVELEIQNDELLQVRTEMEIARARYYDLYDLAPVGYVTISEPGLILEANITAATLLGMSQHTLVSQPISQFIAQENQDAYSTYHKKVFDDGGTQSCDLRMLCHGGKPFWAHLAATAGPDGQGERMCRIVLGDISERKQAEEIADVNRVEIAHLSRVASVGEMAASLAHELNQPLTAILGYVTACINSNRESSNISAATMEYLQEISNEAKRAGEIVRRVRGYVRKSAPEKQLHDISQVVRESISLMRQELARSGVVLRLHLAKDIPQINMDAVQIQQVLVNLIQNGMEAMKTAGCPVHRLLVKTVATETGVKVSVSDAGIAVDPELKERIFESFFTTKPQGLGLGLSICRSIVESHGGQIWASANPDRGMTFAFSLSATRST